MYLCQIRRICYFYYFKLTILIAIFQMEAHIIKKNDVVFSSTALQTMILAYCNRHRLGYLQLFKEGMKMNISIFFLSNP